jgi:EAL domain-containing protein (putative c-di-GMP-specific phosphodiesterase class I)
VIAELDDESVLFGERNEFAEENGLIIELGDHILETACRQAYAWQSTTSLPFTMAVNISAHQFRSPEFVERVTQILHETGLDPHHLELEITESALMSAAARSETILKRLKTIGVGIALDDFGTGYSSLSYLRRFPVDRIKIDKSFVHEIASSRSDTAIVEAVIGLGRNLGLRVIAEGVETVDQARVLSTLGCREVQGFLTGRPGPAEDLAFAQAFTFEHEALVEA